jgi:exonuclease SbcD
MLNGASLLEDQAYVLQQLVDVIAAEQPDAVLMAGDIFDRSLPPTRAVELLDKTLTQIVDRLEKAGHHDRRQPRRCRAAPVRLAPARGQRLSCLWLHLA